MYPKTINFGLYLHYHLDHRADHVTPTIMLMIREFDIPSHADALMPHTNVQEVFFDPLSQDFVWVGEPDWGHL